MLSLQIFGLLGFGIGAEEGHDGREGGGGGEEEHRIVAVEKGIPAGRRDDLPGVADADDGDAVFLAERGIHQAFAVEDAAGFDLAGHHFKAGEDLISEGG